MSSINIEYTTEKEFGKHYTSKKYVSDIRNVNKNAGKGAGEMTADVLKLEEEGENWATSIATEIVNEVIDNALQLVTSEPAFKTIADPKKCPQSGADITEDIVEENFDNKPKPMSEIIEELNKINPDNQVREPMPLEVEVKNLLSEMMSPPYNIVFYDKNDIKGGVGDPPVHDMNHLEAHCVPESTNAPMTVEKKSRVTDLIKHSKQILSEYITHDASKQNQENFEDIEEQVIQVIELDCVKPGEEKFLVHRKIRPEDIPLPEDDEEELIKIPDDQTMDVIDLSSKAFEAEQKAVCETQEDPKECKTNESKKYNITVVMSPNNSLKPDAGSVCESSAFGANSNAKLKNAVCEEKCKNKRWNLGARIMGLFRKNKQQSHTTQTGSRK